MQSLTVRAVAQGVGVIVLLLALYGLSTQNTAAISALQQRTEAQQRQIKDLRTEVDALTQVRQCE
jgi:cell division protein FtsB